MQSSMVKRSLVFALALFAALALQVIMANPAHAAAIVWNGNAGDLDLGTDANWVGGAAPVDGDTLVFDSDQYDYSNYDTVLNNSALTTIVGITLQGANSGKVTITGNDLALTGDVTDSATGSMTSVLDLNVILGADISVATSFGTGSSTTTLDLSTFTLTVAAGSYSNMYSVISGTGGLTLDGIARLFKSNTYSGVTQVNPTGYVGVYDAAALGDVSGVTNVSTTDTSFASFNVCTATPLTIAEAINFSGGGSDYDINVATACGQGAQPTDIAGTVTFTGTVTLSADTIISHYYLNAQFDDLVLGGNTLTQAATSIGGLTINGAKQQAPAEEVITIAKGDSNAATVVVVGNNQKYVINGTRGDTYVGPGGTLNGTGVVGLLNVQTGGTLAPGLSPGCLSSGNLTLAGNYDVEINGATVCTEYDQTDVTGTVDVTNGTLNIIRLASYDPTVDGATFVIIKNDGTEAVTGTFSGLVEGAKTTVDGVEYVVSYEGGDGNDVTLTVAKIATVTAPDTGFGPGTVNFLLIATATVLATGGMVIAGRKLQEAKAKK